MEINGVFECQILLTNAKALLNEAKCCDDIPWEVNYGINICIGKINEIETILAN